MRVELEFAENFTNPEGGFDFTSVKCKELIEKVLTKGEKMLPPIEDQQVFIFITDDEEIHGINKEQRDVDRATDVLSFPMLEHKDGVGEVDPLDKDPETGLLLLGDIILSAERAVEQAKEYGHSIERELCFLICHGFLHLRGFDHIEPEDEKVMMAKAEEILKGIAER